MEQGTFLDLLLNEIHVKWIKDRIQIFLQFSLIQGRIYNTIIYLLLNLSIQVKTSYQLVQKKM